MEEDSPHVCTATFVVKCFMTVGSEVRRAMRVIPMRFIGVFKAIRRGEGRTGKVVAWVQALARISDDAWTRNIETHRFAHRDAHDAHEVGEVA
jgi:hypothetical protein